MSSVLIVVKLYTQKISKERNTKIEKGVKRLMSGLERQMGMSRLRGTVHSLLFIHSFSGY